MQQTQAEDGTTLIMTEASKESREEFVSESRETKHYEEAEVVRGELRGHLDTFQTDIAASKQIRQHVATQVSKQLPSHDISFLF